MPGRLLALPTAVLIALAAPLAVLAAEGDDPFSRAGYYVSAGSSFIVHTWEDEIDDVLPGHVTVDKGVGFPLIAGYRINPYLATELNYEPIKGYDVERGSNRLFRMDSHTFTANARIYLPFGRIQPFALLGVGMAHFDLHKNPTYEMKGGSVSVGGRLGLGVDYYVSEHWVLNATFSGLLTAFEIDVPGPNDVDGVDYLSTALSVTYRF